MRITLPSKYTNIEIVPCMKLIHSRIRTKDNSSSFIISATTRIINVIAYLGWSIWYNKIKELVVGIELLVKFAWFELNFELWNNKREHYPYRIRLSHLNGYLPIPICPKIGLHPFYHFDQTRSIFHALKFHPSLYFQNWGFRSESITRSVGYRHMWPISWW